MGLTLSCCRFYRRDHRVYVVAKARPDRGEAVSTPGSIRRRAPTAGHQCRWDPAYASAIAALKQSGELGRHCRCRTSPYLNNIIEQDHRFIKKRITASRGFRSVEGACRTIEGYEAMHAIRKGQVRWVAKGDPVAQRQIIHAVFAAGTVTENAVARIFFSRLLVAAPFRTRRNLGANPHVIQCYR